MTEDSPAEQCPMCGSSDLRRLPRKLKTPDGWLDIEPIASRCDTCSLAIMDDGTLIPTGD